MTRPEGWGAQPVLTGAHVAREATWLDFARSMWSMSCEKRHRQGGPQGLRRREEGRGRARDRHGCGGA
eukprot:CAMPEP_0203892330 /NCGR_PEP_ID=MMETSP0359-20131031/35531_1 /ASSEMBLY_ACC=CAM_ASM_000338 /TAXON_ID=268821 /ORGANISM="Scrippsiella Hangoei, Strain SHTV-5" /LENGTH=67 /DNA_ID=CAMNT_0050814271 /DNA_START=78 /DNA_END=279 /DNA_ORIENTATION=+